MATKVENPETPHALTPPAPTPSQQPTPAQEPQPAVTTQAQPLVEQAALVAELNRLTKDQRLDLLLDKGSELLAAKREQKPEAELARLDSELRAYQKASIFLDKQEVGLGTRELEEKRLDPEWSNKESAKVQEIAALTPEQQREGYIKVLDDYFEQRTRGKQLSETGTAEEIASATKQQTQLRSELDRYERIYRQLDPAGQKATDEAYFKVPLAEEQPQVQTQQQQRSAEPTTEQRATTAEQQASPPNPSEAQTPVEQAAAPKASPVGELQIGWKQTGQEVAPLLEMRAYLDQLQNAGVAVGAMQFNRGADGKLEGNFKVSYDPASAELATLSGTIDGLKKVGNGLTVTEPQGQAEARQQQLDPAGQARATDHAKDVRAAFAVNQWDALSAQLSQAPKNALSGPEQMQQSAGNDRLKQVAQQQAKVNEQVVQKGTSILDIDTTGNPVSAFLKNFYAQLHGAEKIRQTQEIDYEGTRQQLQQKLLKAAGIERSPEPTVKVASQVEQPAPKAAQQQPVPDQQPTPAPRATDTSEAQPIAKAAQQQPGFERQQLPLAQLAMFGITTEILVAKGQMEKLLRGESTDLMTVRSQDTAKAKGVEFSGKLRLAREADGSVGLQMALPRKELEIPLVVAGKELTAEQREGLLKQGNAGLVTGLKDENGQSYNGYIGVDKQLNSLVILDERKVKHIDEIAGVKLSAEQSKDLRAGKSVELRDMKVGEGPTFSGSARLDAAKASVEIKPTLDAPRVKQTQQQAPREQQPVKLAPDTPKVKLEVPKPRLDTPKPHTPKKRLRGPRL